MKSQSFVKSHFRDFSLSIDQTKEKVKNTPKLNQIKDYTNSYANIVIGCVLTPEIAPFSAFCHMLRIYFGKINL